MAVGLTVAARRGPGTPGERVQSGAGVRIHRKPGEPVVAGEPLFTLYTDTPSACRPRWPNSTAGGALPTSRPRFVR